MLLGASALSSDFYFTWLTGSHNFSSTTVPGASLADRGQASQSRVAGADAAVLEKTVSEYNNLLAWLGTSAARASLYGSSIQSTDGNSISPSLYNASSPLNNIPELKDFVVREIMYDAMQVRSKV